MYRFIALFIITFAITSCSSVTEPELNKTESDIRPLNLKSSAASNTGKWVTAYLASYKHLTPEGDNRGNLPTDEIDWDAFTHLNYFALLANPDGSVTEIEPYNNLNPAGIQAITEAGHEAGVPVLLTVGGWGNYNGFSKAIKPGSRSRFIDNIMAVFSEWGFDGIDVNMEPIKSSDRENYIAFVNELSKRLHGKSTPLRSQPLLTAAVHWQPDLIARMQDKFDQINIMTYNLSGAWTGWVTWHNAPIYDGGYIFPGYDHTVPSADKDVDEFMNAGIPAEKLGIGIDFYGYVWTGVSQPKEEWKEGNAPTVEAEVPYHRIMNEYYKPGYYNWDSVAEAAYLSIETNNREQFISYDNERSIHRKFKFVQKRNLGGAIIWDLGGGYRQYQPSGERDKLLQEVKRVFMEGESNSGNDNFSPSVSVTNPAARSMVTGTVTLAAHASDNHSIDHVQFFVDGTPIGDPITTPPFQYDWSSSKVVNGPHTISAKAEDAAGNQETSSIDVTVSNGSDNGAPAVIYNDALQEEWIDASWSSDTDFTNSAQIYEGSRAIKIDQQSWGALGLHSGNWGNSKDVDTRNYKNLRLAIYANKQNLDLSLSFRNDDNSSFPRVNYGSIPATGNWKVVSIPLKDLNPDNHPVNRIIIQDVSGNSKTYYIDNLAFTHG